MIGFAIYSFEGIGVVMPIMQQAAQPQHFILLLTLAIGTLTIIYVIFGTICYLSFGTATNQVVTEMLSPSIVTTSIKILFCFNLIAGYSITIYPTNLILEGWIFGKL